jgi:hypothetical protein
MFLCDLLSWIYITCEARAIINLGELFGISRDCFIMASIDGAFENGISENSNKRWRYFRWPFEKFILMIMIKNGASPKKVWYFRWHFICDSK